MTTEIVWEEKLIGGRCIMSSLTLDEASELQRYASDARVLEVGSAYGYSTVQMARTDPPPRSILSVDCHEGEYAESLENMRANVRALDERGVVTIAIGNSGVVLPDLYWLGARFDFVFVDGGHSRGSVIHDLSYGCMLVEHGGAIAFHDYGYAGHPDVKSVLDEYRKPTRIVDTLWVLEGL